MDLSVTDAFHLGSLCFGPDQPPRGSVLCLGECCSLSSSQQVREDHSLSSLGKGTADCHSFCPPFILNQDYRKKQTEAVAGIVYMLQLEIKIKDLLSFITSSYEVLVFY